MRRFSIVEFKDGVHLIPTSWIYNDNKKCYWPHYKNQNKNKQAIYNEERPDNNKWSSYEILRIFGAADSYTDGMRKVKLAEQISDIVSEKNDTEKNKSRHNWAKKKFTSDDEKEDSENEDSENEDFENEDSEHEDSENEDSEEKSRTTQEICKKKTSEMPFPILPSVRKETTTQMLKKKNKIDNQFETSNAHIINSSLYDFNKYNMKESFTNDMQFDISYLRQQSASSSCKTDSYTDGMRKVKLTEQISDIESEKNDTEKNKSRHNWAKRKFTSDDEKEDSENEDSEIQDSENEDFEEKSRTTQEICKKKTSKIPLLPTLPSVRKETTTQMSKKKNKIADDNQLETSNTHIMNSSLYDFNKFNMKDFQTEVFRKLNIIIHQVKMMDERMKMHEEQCRFNLNRGEDNRSEDNKDDILQDEEIGLPLHDELALHMLEQKLKSKKFYENMVCTLKSLGGVSVHSCTVNLLKKLITNPLAEMYSMAGAKKKKAFRDLILYKIILKTVRIHYKEATETQITRIIAKWLMQAKTRREREESRNIEKCKRDQLRKETGSSNETFYEQYNM